ncbi:MAG: HEAT repeat domain-containing protein [Anaerolineae bacterium]|nr:HEAT repeat domain-containing protein [Anaerolineae bacterium]
MTSTITGREPRLSARKQGQRQLSLRELATRLNVLPPDAISVDAAAEAMRSDAFYVRYAAAKLLSKRGDREARLAFQDILTNGNAPSRASAARHLHGFTWFAAEPLIRLALRDSDNRVRGGAVRSLCELRELNAYRLLVGVLQDEADDVRLEAAWGLHDCQDAEAVPVLEAVLLADDPDVRVKALESLGENNTPEAIPVVRAALKDSDSDVVYAATLSLIELAGEACIPELSAIIHERDGILRQPVLRGFFHATNYLKIDLGNCRIVDQLIDALEAAVNDDLPGVREAAAWVLAWMRHDRTAAILRDAYYREGDSAVKAHILRVSVSLMAEGSESLLNDALFSADDPLREAAERIVRERAQRAAPVPQYA